MKPGHSVNSGEFVELSSPGVEGEVELKKHEKGKSFLPIPSRPAPSGSGPENMLNQAGCPPGTFLITAWSVLIPTRRIIVNGSLSSSFSKTPPHAWD